ncbi:hypothetical protein SaSA73_0965 [Streptococcus agalactiae]|nr:hypothetical protein SaSA73_0965 [Streptococcus agalactiae]
MAFSCQHHNSARIQFSSLEVYAYGIVHKLCSLIKEPIFDSVSDEQLYVHLATGALVCAMNWHIIRVSLKVL